VDTAAVDTGKLNRAVVYSSLRAKKSALA